VASITGYATLAQASGMVVTTSFSRPRRSAPSARKHLLDLIDPTLTDAQRYAQKRQRIWSFHFPWRAGNVHGEGAWL
jgi:hypothetical protein